MSETYLVIELNHQPVELCKLLKIANLVSGGGEAKVVISEGYVLLNGDVEYQKRKKVYHEDVIEFNGEVVQLLINEELAETEVTPEDLGENATNDVSKTASDAPKTKTAQNKAKSKKNAAKKAKSDFTPQLQDIEIVKVPRKRKPISF